MANSKKTNEAKASYRKRCKIAFRSDFARLAIDVKAQHTTVCEHFTAEYNEAKAS